MLACAIASLALLRAPPLRADSRSAIQMATSVDPKKSSFGTFMEQNSMKMPTVKKGAKPKLRPRKLPPAMLGLTGKFKKQYAKQDIEVPRSDADLLST